MGVMFQEQARDLEKQVVAVTRERDNLERDRDRMAELWREQKQKAAAHEKTLEAQAAQIVSLERQLVDHRAVAGRLADAEKLAGDAEKARLSFERKWEKEAKDHAVAVSALAEARDELGGAKVERDRLRAEIGPFRSLIGALKAKAVAEDEILAELGRLDG